MPNFHEVELPRKMSYGTSGGPGFQTQISTSTAGKEKRNIQWSRERGKWNIAQGIKTEDDFNAFIAFFRNRFGKGYGFRYFDPFDFDFQAMPCAGVTDGLNKAFQLQKIYTDGTYSYTRAIQKPVAGKVTPYDNGAPLDATATVLTLTQVAVVGAVTTYSYSGYTGTAPVAGKCVIFAAFAHSGNNVTAVLATASGGSSGTVTVVTTTQDNETHSGTGTSESFVLDTTTGIFIVTPAPIAGHTITADCAEFDVPVRFDMDEVAVSWDSFDSRSWDAPIIELKTAITYLVLTQVAVTAGVATYSFSASLGPAPRVGMWVVFAGLGVSGNNLTAKLTGIDTGTVSVVATTQSNETHSGTGSSEN